MRIVLYSIPHAQHRYPTVGDWLTDHGHVSHIIVSDMGNEDYSFLVALHELVEAWLCTKRGISQEAVDKFDMDFEQGRDFGDESEPGDDPCAPYNAEHHFASKIERLVADELGICWDHYDNAVSELSK